MSPAKVKCLLILCTLLLHVIAVTSIKQPWDISINEFKVTAARLPTQTTNNDKSKDKDEAKGEFLERRLTGNYEWNEHDNDDENKYENFGLRKKVQPLKNIFMGIYKNYKSTYLGNKTSVEYKQHLHERNGDGALLILSPNENSTKKLIDGADEYQTVEDVELQPNTSQKLELTTTIPTSSSIIITPPYGQLNKREGEKKIPKCNKQLLTTYSPIAPTTIKRKSNKSNSLSSPPQQPIADGSKLETAFNEYSYIIGPGVNMSLDMSNDVVHVQLDGENLREIFRSHWLSDNTEQGRGKKYDMMSKILPLFILPFLIQSAIVPFLVTKLKLLLMKSILVGKLAIFLLIISALRNSNKMQSYEVAPSYWASEPSRRSELASATSSMSYGAGSYRVEGKPAWIN